ncbi:MAG: 50S ribosomal protein L9 [Dehalococcoidales bacterium]|nr:50S ribosomal protein L9 [Dehalococcoidales bacterium]
MKVIFLENVPNVARAGETREVADGYGRNYLLPKKLALVSKPGAAASVKALIAAKEETDKMKKLAAEIEGKQITLKVKMGAKERMHGSITTANIATELQNVIGQVIDKRKIELDEPIKQLGDYEISIKLAKGIEPKFKLVIIEKEKEPEKETGAEADKKTE